mgnify:CR=1 FL=1
MGTARKPLCACGMGMADAAPGPQLPRFECGLRGPPLPLFDHPHPGLGTARGPFPSHAGPVSISIPLADRDPLRAPYADEPAGIPIARPFSFSTALPYLLTVCV